MRLRQHPDVNMLSHLTIHNFGLIDSLTVELSPSLNAFTGETGAGKSIIVDALRCALGSRMSSSVIRDPAKPVVIEASFALASRPELLSDVSFADFVPDGETCLIIRRSLLPDGRGKITVNGLAVTLAQLREMGRRLADLHGPHDHQLLFSEESHIGIVDRLSSLSLEKKAYEKIFRSRAELQRSLDELTALACSREIEMDTLSRQIKELEQVPLNEDARNKTAEDSTRVINAETLYTTGGELMEILENEETGVSSSLRRAFSKTRALSAMDPSLETINENLERAQEELEGVVSSLSGYLETLSFSPSEAEEIKRRQDTYCDILRKYGPSLEDATAFYINAKKKYALLADIEHNTGTLSARIAEEEKALKKAADALTSKRTKTARALKTTIETELKDLGMPHIKFECRIKRAAPTSSGHDAVSFYISPNAGEDLKPLSSIASSGEAARVMLALKKALTKVDTLPCLVFDEIDSHIGGRLGSVTGAKLKELSSGRQVILITHLPQIASFADRHIKVSKTVLSQRTSVSVRTLEGPERADELAKMMNGAKKSKIALDLAEDMLEKAQK